MDVIDPVPKLGYRAVYLKQRMRDKLTEHKQYIARVGQDMHAGDSQPEVAV